MDDRRVHARTADGGEVVRYDRAGKWYVEWPQNGQQARYALTVRDAVLLASEPGAEPRFRVPGGQIFDARLRTRLAALGETETS